MFSVLYTCEFKRIFFFEGRKEGIFVTKRVVFFVLWYIFFIGLVFLWLVSRVCRKENFRYLIVAVCVCGSLSTKFC